MQPMISLVTYPEKKTGGEGSGGRISFERFSYCQYPFILSIVAKKSILQRDSEQQMILNARRSLLNRALHHQAPDIDVFFLNLNVRRSHLVSDSLNEIARKQSDLKKKLKVTFVGEPGLDMGGLTKEWFLLLIRQIFSPDYGMFVYHNKARCYWFSTTQLGNLREYNLIGQIWYIPYIAHLMGLAVYNSIILDLHFPTACYKKLLNPPVVPHNIENAYVGICKFTTEDLAEVMPDVAVGLNELLAYEGNVEEDFCMNFQVSVEEFGEVKTHTLKYGGEDIPVTKYVDLYVDLVLNKAIAQPFKAFYLGFHSVCASNALIMLRPEEVEMLVCGCPKLDLDELRKVTVYDSFEEDEPLIRDFWDILKSFNSDVQKQFLRFATGSDRVPVGGMGEMAFKISAQNTNTDIIFGQGSKVNRTADRYRIAFAFSRQQSQYGVLDSVHSIYCTVNTAQDRERLYMRAWVSKRVSGVRPHLLQCATVARGRESKWRGCRGQHQGTAGVARRARYLPPLNDSVGKQRRRQKMYDPDRAKRRVEQSRPLWDAADR
ncbi:hypothetical protein HPB50_021139 [Hyalomma asiaticum]|uniref:Uncharacterized protein n=1 Tax=Hyalomma asiaticum TaxID=266040 RepID=A0ACB7TNL6_HYAAI|nr:hypothetical protein HPB50_021139 [Hyalomma asiaticum]